jgi:ureidoglycolate hydrolase
MHAIEFQATINQGIIEIPQQYRHQLSKHAKVIVLMEETPQKTGIVTQLLQHPLKRQHFTPLNREEIYER